MLFDNHDADVFLFDLHMQIQAEGTIMHVLVRGKHPTAGFLALCVCVHPKVSCKMKAIVMLMHFIAERPHSYFRRPLTRRPSPRWPRALHPSRFSPSLQPGVCQTLPLKSKSYSSTPGLWESRLTTTKRPPHTHECTPPPLYIQRMPRYSGRQQ